MSLQSLLSVRCASDALLHHISAIGLAAARGTALVIDLDSGAQPYPGSVTVAQLVEGGIRRRHLEPAGDGVVVIPSGPAVPYQAALDLIEALASGWPAVVVRVGSADWPLPVVPVQPLIPTVGGGGGEPRIVYQAVRRQRRRPPLVLPPLRRGQVWAMIGGRVDPKWAWVRAWRAVWEATWT